MKRLTYRDQDGFPMMKKRGGFKSGGVQLLALYEDTGLTPEEIDMDHEAAEQLRRLCRGCDLDRLEELAKVDKDGRVVVLPCKVGDTVYLPTHNGTICFHKIRRFERNKDGDCMCSSILIPLDAFGKTVFLTREEAEAALRREQG
jgi:hypothetical protein